MLKLADLIRQHALFAFQRHGTAVVGTFFGPVMLAWFSSLAGLN